MKKFVVISVLAAAGITVGLASRHEPGTPLAAAVETTTTSSTVAVVEAAPATTTTKPVAAAKATPTTQRVASPTTTTTARPASTTTTSQPAATSTTSPAPTSTTTTTVAAMTPTCAVSVASPTAPKGSTQEVRVTSNMPSTKTRITIQYPQFGTGKPNPRQTFTPTTGGDGAVTQAFGVIATSTVPVPVVVEFYDAAGRIMAGSCQTSFQAPE